MMCNLTPLDFPVSNTGANEKYKKSEKCTLYDGNASNSGKCGYLKENLVYNFLTPCYKLKRSAAIVGTCAQANIKFCSYI